MTQTEEFNPIETARKVEESYREYIATTIHFADADLQSQLEEILRKPGYLAKGPFLEAAPPRREIVEAYIKRLNEARASSAKAC